MKKLLLGFLLAAVSLPAYAWGAREQGALAGLVVGSMIHQHHHHRHGFHSHYIPPPRVYYHNYVQPAPIYNYVQPVQPQVVVIDNNCRRVPVLDQNNQIIAFTQVCNNVQVND